MGSGEPTSSSLQGKHFTNRDISLALRLISDSRAFCVSSRKGVGDGKITPSYLPQPGDGREKMAMGEHLTPALCRQMWGPFSGLQIAGCCLLIHVLAGLWATESPPACTALGDSRLFTLSTAASCSSYAPLHGCHLPVSLPGFHLIC